MSDKTETQAKILAALRSGEYKQCNDRLHDGERFCALGVICDVYAKEHGLRWDGADDDHFILHSKDGPFREDCDPEPEDCGLLPPRQVAAWAFPEASEQWREPYITQSSTISTLNDHKLLTLEQIADVLEEYWEHGHGMTEERLKELTAAMPRDR